MSSDAREARSRLTGAQWSGVTMMVGVIVALHVLGWVTLVGLVAPQHLALGAHTFGIGVGVAAYTLGMRHAFDADHICAIDNTTRKLIADGKKPRTVGFFFALGHATVVFAMSVVLALGVRHFGRQIAADGSTLDRYVSVIGPAVAGTFLYVVAAMNVAVLAAIGRNLRHLRRGGGEAASLDTQITLRGPTSRIFGRLLGAITKPWHIYPVGVLFGLGFDTASEIALLVLAASGSAAGVPWYAILCLPLLFAAGMCLFDTIDGAFMNVAYAWAAADPQRRVYYNFALTAVSVVTAFVVGTLELVSAV